jgi:hypothetical protein
LVYTPLAIRHDDHVLVREAVRRIRRRPCLYVDYPYALKYPIAPQRPPAGLLDAYKRRDALLGDADVNTKLMACREYSGELERLRRCASFGDFATAANLRREMVYLPDAVH